MPHAYIRQIAQSAKAAFYQIAQADSAAKNAALLRLADLIHANQAALFATGGLNNCGVNDGGGCFLYF